MNGSVIMKQQGFFSELLETVSSHLNFSYEIDTPLDDEFGIMKEDGAWSGAVGMLLRRQADIIPFLIITPGRQDNSSGHIFGHIKRFTNVFFSPDLRSLNSRDGVSPPLPLSWALVHKFQRSVNFFYGPLIRGSG